jgi:curved DNA-binding protein CbpA
MTYTEQSFIDLLQAQDTPEGVRKEYLKLSKKVHPDLNPELGKEPMQALNTAYEKVMKGWDNRQYQATGKDGQKTDQTYKYDDSFEKMILKIVDWAQRSPYTEEIELIGLWLWVSGSDKDNCPFRAPKAEKNDQGKWIPTEEDRRPSWEAMDGTPVRFEWSRSNKKWYLDFRKLYTRKYDGKIRSSYGIHAARQKYGSTKIGKKADEGIVKVG